MKRRIPSLLGFASGVDLVFATPADDYVSGLACGFVLYAAIVLFMGALSRGEGEGPGVRPHACVSPNPPFESTSQLDTQSGFRTPEGE